MSIEIQGRPWQFSFGEFDVLERTRCNKNRAVVLKRHEMLIDDKSVASPKTLKVVNPSTEEVISEFPSGTVENIDPAVMDAGRAQESSAVLTTIRTRWLSATDRDANPRTKGGSRLLILALGPEYPD